jgi:ADP-heptose:LPS heptosyltransferase
LLSAGKFGFWGDKRPASGRVPDRILILTQKEIGDLIVMTPLVRALHRHYPGHELWIASRPVAREVYAGNPAVTGFLDVTVADVKRGFFLRRIAKFFGYLFTIRRLKPKLVIQPESNDVMALWSYFSGAASRIGIQKQTFRFLFSGRNAMDEGYQSALLFYLGFLAPLGIQPAGSQTELFAFEKETPRRKTDSILIHPGARLRERLWPAAKWVELIVAIRKKYPRLRIQIVDSLHDPEICRELSDALPAGLKCEWVRVENFRDLCTAIAGARLALTLDSAPRHVAAAYDIPTVSLLAHWITNDWQIYDAVKHRIVLSYTQRPDYGIQTIAVGKVLSEFEKQWRIIKRG